jgi:hypothetical protein
VGNGLGREGVCGKWAWERECVGNGRVHVGNGLRREGVYGKGAWERGCVRGRGLGERVCVLGRDAVCGKGASFLTQTIIMLLRCGTFNWW